MKKIYYLIGSTLLTFILCTGMLSYEYYQHTQNSIGVESGFRIQDRKQICIFPPNQQVALGNDDHFKSNPLGLWGSTEHLNHQLTLVLGASTSLRYAQRLQYLADTEKSPLLFWSAAKWHNSVLEIRFELETFIQQQFIPDQILLMPGQVFYRDTEERHWNFKHIPRPVIEEKAFSYQSGSAWEWPQYWLRLRRNQFYYSDYNLRQLEMEKGKLPQQPLASLIKDNLELYQKELQKIIQLCQDHSIRLYLISAPLNQISSTPEQINLIKKFNSITENLAQNHQCPFIDFFKAFGPEQASKFGDTFHWNRLGTHKAAQTLYPILKASAGKLNSKRNIPISNQENL